MTGTSIVEIQVEKRSVKGNTKQCNSMPNYTIIVHQMTEQTSHTHLSLTPSASNSGVYSSISVGTVYRYGSIRMPL